MSSKRVYYCDRCGKEIPLNVLRGRALWSSTFVKTSIAYILSGNEDDLDISDSADDSFDLCEECSGSFVKWFKDGKRGENK